MKQALGDAALIAWDLDNWTLTTFCTIAGGRQMLLVMSLILLLLLLLTLSKFHCSIVLELLKRKKKNPENMKNFVRKINFCSICMLFACNIYNLSILDIYNLYIYNVYNLSINNPVIFNRNYTG